MDNPLAIVDYGAGNLRSVQKALEKLGHSAKLTSDPDEVVDAPGVILPGVGAARGIMGGLRRSGLVEPIRQAVRNGKPFLGICMGLQVLMTLSDEGDEPCLDLVPGRVRRLPEGLKVPHMGWNSVRFVAEHPIWSGIPDGTYFYFVHSYYVEPHDRGSVLGETEYGLWFPAALAAGNVIGTQFHPEKSGTTGIRIYDNFARLVRDGLPSHPRD